MRIVIVLMFLLSCNQDKQIEDNLNKQKHHDQEDSCYYMPCKYYNSNPINTNEIIKNANMWMKGNDSCVIGLIKRMSNDIKNHENIKFIECFDSLQKVSDGYVSELLSEEIFQLSKSNSKIILDYILSKKKIRNDIFVVNLAYTLYIHYIFNDYNSSEEKIKQHFFNNLNPGYYDKYISIIDSLITLSNEFQ